MSLRPLKKAAAIAAVTAALGAGSVALATPAQAQPRGTVLGVFPTLQECVEAGSAGVTNGRWITYNCTTIGGAGKRVLRVVFL